MKFINVVSILDICSSTGNIPDYKLYKQQVAPLCFPTQISPSPLCNCHKLFQWLSKLGGVIREYVGPAIHILG